MAHSFTIFLKRVATVSLCLHYGSAVLCLYCRFPVCERHCSQRPIKHKHWTMDDWRTRLCSKDTVLEYLCWCHPKTTQQDTKFVKLFYIDTYTMKANHYLRFFSSDNIINMSSGLSGWIIVIKKCGDIPHSHIWSESDFRDTALWLSGVITLSCMFMLTNRPHDVCQLDTAEAVTNRHMS